MSTMVTASAHVRIFAAEPPLSALATATVTASLEKLFRQFEREGRCAVGAAWSEHAGRFVVIAWDGPALSGCSHDKVAQVLQATEAAQGVALLASPPLAVDVPPRLVTRAALRAELASGSLTLESAWWPLRATTLAAWRAGSATVRDSGLFGA